MWPVGLRLPCSAAYGSGLAALAAFLAVGLIGAHGYLDNFLQYRGFPPPREPAFVRAPGTTQRILVPSPALGGRRQEAYVYLPTGYATHPRRRYPVLYLLHGFPGRPLAFLETVQMGIVDDALTVRGRAQPLILVMPFGSTGTFTDEEWVNGVRAGSGWATFVAHDLVRAVDERYRTIASPAGRAIAGLSEGGYGAIDIALHHPHEFSVVESWSGYQRPDKIRSIFGSSLHTLAANDPRRLLPRVAPVLRRLGTYFWFYSGSNDPLRKQNASFARELARARIAHRYFEVYGGHNWALWRDNARAAYIAAAARLGHA
jgi:enterochelin esterase-like enzyme